MHSPVTPDVTEIVLCLVDSGANFTVFDEEVAVRLGIDLQTITPEGVVGVGGTVPMWMHDVILHLPGGPVTANVGFTRGLPVNGLLGMSGFFEHFRITFDGAAQTCEFERLAS